MRAIVIAVLFAVAGCAFQPVSLSEDEYQLEFANFVSQFSKEYEAVEFFQRYKIFKSKLDFVRSHNAGNSSWIAGINQFSDRSDEEFAALFTPLPLSNRKGVSFGSDLLNGGEPMAEVDWRTKGAVSPVGNQGQCGSCWAFSTVSALEGWCVTVSKQPLYVLSVQQLMDCSKNGNQGCNGGYPEYAFDWIKENGGLCTAAEYGPYIARDAQCKKGCTPKCPITGGLETEGEDNLIKLLNIQPVSAAITVNNAFQYYKSGIYNTPCGTKSISHTLLVVGYTDQYYIIKNSWGTSWGMVGYINMVRGSNICNIGDLLDVPTPQPSGYARSD